jgi:post-segregation antitoxin (ccd killing protein)
MRMARVNVYLPDELAKKAKEKKLNISALAQQAVESALHKNAWAEWLDEVRKDPPLAGLSDEVVRTALQEARDEMWGEDDAPAVYRRIRGLEP